MVVWNIQKITILHCAFILLLPPPPSSYTVLFSVNETTVVVRAGEAVRVNCSQTGYIRTQWRWRRNGVDLPTAPSDRERVYTELSGRSKVGPVSSSTVTGTTVDNHQSLFLHLRHARVMDNGKYTCITETDTQTVTVDVQPPGGNSIHRNSYITILGHLTIYGYLAL